jgi:hypothetical protein
VVEQNTPRKDAKNTPVSQTAGFGGVFSMWWSKTRLEKMPKIRLKSRHKNKRI